MDRELRVGDYLRYRIYGGEKLRHPMWCIVTYLQNEGTQGRAAVLINPARIGLRWVTFDRDIRSSERTMRKDYPPEKAYGRAVAEVARRAMLGVAN